MMQVLMQNSQRPPSTQYSASSSSNSFSSPTITSSSSSYSSPASSNTAPILPSSQSSISSSFRPSTSSSSPTSSSFATGSSSPDSYGNPLAQPISTSSSSQPSPSSPLPPQSAAAPASSSYGSARAPAISSNSFSLPQGDSDPLVKAASTLDQDQYETELATLDAVIEMLSSYQQEQARRRRRKLKEATNLVEERRGQERVEREETYKPLRFPEGPSPGRVKAVLALFQNRRMDDLLNTKVPDSDFIDSHILDAKVSETDFKRMLKSAGIWPKSATRGGENKEETRNKQNKEKVEEIRHSMKNTDADSISDLRVERFF